MAHSPLYVRLIGSKQWRALRAEVISEEPVCQSCRRAWSTCVHHITPIESGANDAECEALTFRRSNLQALCFRCHKDIHAAERSHSKEAHKQRSEDRLAQWIARHSPNNK